MSGFLTRMGMGVVMTAGAAKAAPAPVVTPRVSREAGSAPTLRSVPLSRKPVGPFQAAVERLVVARNAGGRPTALVQLHLSRPAGPVPFGERRRVDGVGALGGRWMLSSITWLPEGTMPTQVPGLGQVAPAEHEAEARGVFRFVYMGRDRQPIPPSSFTFELPSGDATVLTGLVTEGQLS
ncbi:MAG: hypothetical protein HZB16_11060 [Armatimonadetes bacterium]|nr:hypothetical protein [Armatimonadota bacterium]